MQRHWQQHASASPDTFVRSQRATNRCELLKAWVERGDGLGMVGGYLSFSGIDGKARSQYTAIATVLPATMYDGDDRVQRPEGVVPTLAQPDHPVLAGIDGDWPHFLGYNRLATASASDVTATIGDHVLVSVGEFGRGRSAAFASDCGPHWGPPALVEWSHDGRFSTNLVRWLARSDA